jgi:hypothetical protein
MDSQPKIFDLRRASAQLYRRWVRWYGIGLGLFVLLLSLPYAVPVSLHILSGRIPSSDALAIYLAIIGAAYPAAGFLLVAGIIGGAPRPIRMTLGNAEICLESQTGRRTYIDWTDPRLRLVLLDQSEYSARTGTDAGLGYRIDGTLWFRAALTREAFEALIAEARSRGLDVTRERPSRWSVASATPGTLGYRIRHASPELSPTNPSVG